jgi:hypothetical protein
MQTTQAINVPATLKTFRNTTFTKRNSECTSVVACQAYEAPDAHYVEASVKVLNGLQPLWNQGGVQFYGYL